MGLKNWHGGERKIGKRHTPDIATAPSLNEESGVSAEGMDIDHLFEPFRSAWGLNCCEDILHGLVRDNLIRLPPGIAFQARLQWSSKPHCDRLYTSGLSCSEDWCALPVFDEDSVKDDRQGVLPRELSGPGALSGTLCADKDVDLGVWRSIG